MHIVICSSYNILYIRIFSFKTNVIVRDSVSWFFKMFPKILIKRIIIRLNIRNSVLELILKTFQLFLPKFSSINILYDRENRLTRPIMINFNFFVARNYIMRILLLYENRETCLRIVSAQLWMAFWSSYSISVRHI